MARLVSSLILYPIAVALVAALYRQSALAAGLLAVLAVVAIVISRLPGDVPVLVGGACLGPTAEIVAVHYGAWTYHTPDFLGIPLWLPVAWGLAALLIKRISEGVVEIGRCPDR